MKIIYLLPLFLTMLFSCTDKGNISLDGEQANVLTMDSLFDDTTKVLDVKLPVLIDSANQILVHEIHIAGGKGRDVSFASKKSGDYYGPSLTNLIFEDAKKNESRLLTNNQLQISSYEVCHTITRYILYRVIDRDFNKDGILDYKDIQSLYISNLDGTGFSKITKDKEAPQNGVWIYPLNRYYFRASEYADNNGYSGLQNKIHYYYLQFDEQGYRVVEYNPLETLNK